MMMEGAKMALRDHPNLHLKLVGKKEVVESEMRRLNIPAQRVDVVHAAQVISMIDPPTTAIRNKKDSSISRALDLHAAGEAQAVVSSGNTGAQIVASTFSLGRLEGVLRPVIGSFLPTVQGQCFLLDIGANPDCKAMNLFQFGIMGAIFVEAVLGMENPRVGLLSIGAEETKGNETSLFAYQLFAESHLNFIGNIEGSDLLAGKVDVAVCDGFVGNLILKFGESFPEFMLKKYEASGNGYDSEGLKLFIAENLNPDRSGGAPILGVKGVSVVCHGASSALAIASGINVAIDMAGRNINQLIAKQISEIRRFYEMNKYFLSLRKRWERHRDSSFWGGGKFFNWFSDKEIGE